VSVLVICPACAGRGFTLERVPDGHGGTDVETFDCHACSGCCAVTA
jgi:hypothetical protein